MFFRLFCNQSLCDAEFNKLCQNVDLEAFCYLYERCISQRFCKQYPPGSNALKLKCDPHRCDSAKSLYCQHPNSLDLCRAYADCAGVKREAFCYRPSDEIKHFCGCTDKKEKVEL